MNLTLKLDLPEDAEIHTVEELQGVLDQISFDHSVIDFRWRFEFRPITLPSALDQTTNTTVEQREGWLLWASFERPDIKPPHTVARGRGRDEIILKGMKTSGVVKTCWVLVEMLVRHELMEGFKFMDVQIFNPHNSVYELMLPHLIRDARVKESDQKVPGISDADMSLSEDEDETDDSFEQSKTGWDKIF